MSLLNDYVLKQSDLTHNNANRVPICLCIDTSYSMITHQRMQRVNDGVRKFIADSRDDIYASDAIDLCIVTFGAGGASVSQPFANVNDINFRDLKPAGETPLGAAVFLALEELQKRAGEYSATGISSYKPCLIIMSDGNATDQIDQAVEKVQAQIRARRLKVYCIDLSEKSESASLARFSPDGSVEPIGSLDIDHFFSMLSKSAAGLSTSTPDDEMVLQF